LTGAGRRLNELGVLAQIDAICAVPGESIVAAPLADSSTRADQGRSVNVIKDSRSGFSRPGIDGTQSERDRVAGH
jgi:hypothetical protein